MSGTRRIFMVGDIAYDPVMLFKEQLTKLSKGFIRLGHDVRLFSYSGAISQLSPFKGKKLSRFFYKKKADKLLVEQIKAYEPHIVISNFPRLFDQETIALLKEAVPGALFMGIDGDAWPHLRPKRMETANKLDVLATTNDGEYLQHYKDAGVPTCAFLPNFCDPDTDRRYRVDDKWKTDILWTGKVRHQADHSDTLRERLVARLEQKENCTLYGCCGRKKITGIEYLYAISGARISVSVNAVNSVRLYHSDRLIHYLSCGTFVLSKRVPDTELLFNDGKHLRYFDEIDEFFDLADWYLKHPDERKRIADEGMRFSHENYNCVRIAGYLLDLADHGTYRAPWTASQ